MGTHEKYEEFLETIMIKDNENKIKKNEWITSNKDSLKNRYIEYVYDMIENDNIETMEDWIDWCSFEYEIKHNSKNV
jgi:hypothetical protein